MRRAPERLSAREQQAKDAATVRDEELLRNDAKKRRDGIVHTPPELARFVVRAVDELVRGKLGLRHGLADAALDIVDPACGPGAFLAALLDVQETQAASAARLIGIDLDARALAAARELCPAAALELVRADTLRDASLVGSLRLDSPARALALVGNPPWTVSSARATAAMQTLLEDFRCDEHGVRLAERKLGVLSDAYVRFLRWAAQLARGREAGAVLGLVTNASFLDGPVHRGMRAALTRWFDEIDVLDLGGSALLARERRSGKADGNVFGVRPSVAITFLVRRAGRAGARDGHARVRYARMFGHRDEKLEQLARAQHDGIAWQDVAATEGGRPFVARVVSKQAASQSARYMTWPSLAQCMPFHREGVQSNRDAVVIDADRERLLARLRAFAAGARSPELAPAERGLAHYDPARARKAVAAALELDPDGRLGISIRRIAYRPFDVRWFCPVPPLCHRPRPELLRAFDLRPLALVSVRKDRGSAGYAHFAAASDVIDNCFLSARSSCRARAFPLCAPDGSDNLAASWSSELARRLGRAHGMDARRFVAFALCVLASRSYRERFAAELHADYPRLPWPGSMDELEGVLAAGERVLAVFLAPAQAAAELAPVSELRVGHHAVPAHSAVALAAALEAAELAVLPLLITRQGDTDFRFQS